MLALHIPLICSITFKLWSGAYLTFRLIKQVTIDTIHQTQDAVKSALSMSTLQSACGLTNGRIEIHENLLEDPGVIDTKSD